MNYFDAHGNYATVTLLAAAEITATGNGSGVDMLNYAGKAKIIVISSAGTGTSPTLDLKIQASADNSTWADVSGATFTQIVDAATVEAIGVDLNSAARYLRVVKTAGGTTPSFYAGVVAICAQEQR